MTEENYSKANSEYLKNNPNWHVEDSPWKARQIMKMLKRNPLPIKSIAEIGCGAGEILNQLHLNLPQDTTFHGYDISPDAIRLAKSREKDRLIFKNENLLDTNVKFDLLLMIFEHVDNYLGFLKASLPKSTYTIFHIPLDLSVLGVLRDTLTTYRKSVGHLHYFSQATALATLADSGYEVIDYFYTAESLDLPRKTLKSKLAYIPRAVSFAISQNVTAKLFGGFSLLVLAKNVETKT
jgi:SAM-dependent methyltransferase